MVGHHPVYSSGGAHGDTAELQQYIEPLLHKYHVQVRPRQVLFNTFWL